MRSRTTTGEIRFRGAHPAPRANRCYRQRGSRRSGGGVRLVSLLDAVQPYPEATHLTVESDDGSFSASVPLAAVVESGVVLYRLGSQALPTQQGGPFRFLMTDAQTCATGGADLCANVKGVGRIALNAGPGRDTRPMERTNR